MLTVIEYCFKILKDVSKEMRGWQSKSLDEIEDKDIYQIIKLLKFFLKLKSLIRKK